MIAKKIYIFFVITLILLSSNISIKSQDMSDDQTNSGPEFSTNIGTSATETPIVTENPETRGVVENGGIQNSENIGEVINKTLEDKITSTDQDIQNLSTDNQEKNEINITDSSSSQEQFESGIDVLNNNLESSTTIIKSIANQTTPDDNNSITTQEKNIL